MMERDEEPKETRLEQYGGIGLKVCVLSNPPRKKTEELIGNSLLKDIIDGRTKDNRKLGRMSG